MYVCMCVCVILNQWGKDVLLVNKSFQVKWLPFARKLNYLPSSKK